MLAIVLTTTNAVVLGSMGIVRLAIIKTPIATRATEQIANSDTMLKTVK